MKKETKQVDLEYTPKTTHPKTKTQKTIRSLIEVRVDNSFLIY